MSCVSVCVRVCMCLLGVEKELKGAMSIMGWKNHWILEWDAPEKYFLWCLPYPWLTLGIPTVSIKDVNVNTNHPRTLIKCRFRFSKSRGCGEDLRIWVSVKFLRKAMSHILSSRDLACSGVYFYVDQLRAESSSEEALKLSTLPYGTDTWSLLPTACPEGLL